MTQDFSFPRHPTKAKRSRFASWRIFLFAKSAIIPFCCRMGWKGPLAATILLLLVSLFGSETQVAAHTPPTIHHESIAATLPTPLNKTPYSAPRSTTIQRGGSASNALDRLGFTSQQTQAIVQASQSIHPLSKVRPGQKITRTKSEFSTQVSMPLDSTHSLNISQSHGGAWQAEILKRETTNRWITYSGTIRDNLFLDASRAGLDNHVTMNLVNIFAWDIDFARNLRQGDRFSVLLNELFDHQGKRIGSTILAAEFVNQGKRYRAIRFTDPKGDSAYFSPDGKSLRKNYLKAPVKFTRISSRFSLARMHPILGYTRAHRGVDYAAPTGTPIHAIGAGRITFRGWRHGYGNFIIIRHRNRHNSTAYGHMSRFAKGQHKGSWVKQGQVIGFVGMTGLATGPHLHFEFRIDGRAINPLLIKRIPARPIPKKLWASFQRQSRPRLLAIEQSRQHREVAWQ
ncbi:MAG: peptidoglycan DD-metalloendopeptidase family protein [Mariprofundales bacterium]|nr:peptidoglycan DD-metalloendopeptidase family protein [Mariprofundales bacterium]